MTLEIATLELDVDFGGQVGQQTCIFELGPIGGESAEATITQSLRTGYLVDSQFGNIASTVEGLLQDDTAPAEPEQRGFHIGAGDGQHAIEISFQTPGQTRKPNGDLFQWGSSSNGSDGPNGHTATGAGTVQQMQTLFNVLRIGSADSRNPARFKYGEISPDGYLEDHLKVVFEEPSVSLTSSSPASGDGSLVLIDTRSLDEAYDAVTNDTR